MRLLVLLRLLSATSRPSRVWWITRRLGNTCGGREGGGEPQSSGGVRSARAARSPNKYAKLRSLRHDMMGLSCPLAPTACASSPTHPPTRPPTHLCEEGQCVNGLWLLPAPHRCVIRHVSQELGRHLQPHAHNSSKRQPVSRILLHASRLRPQPLPTSCTVHHLVPCGMLVRAAVSGMCSPARVRAAAWCARPPTAGPAHKRRGCGASPKSCLTATRAWWSRKRWQGAGGGSLALHAARVCVCVVGAAGQLVTGTERPAACLPPPLLMPDPRTWHAKGRCVLDACDEQL